jgi:hypothetical protein
LPSKKRSASFATTLRVSFLRARLNLRHLGSERRFAGSNTSTRFSASTPFDSLGQKQTGEDLRKNARAVVARNDWPPFIPVHGQSPVKRTAAIVLESLWIILGLASLAEGLFGAFEFERHPTPIFWPVTINGVLSLATAITHALRSRLFRIVGGITGTLLGLYGLVLIFFGTEDVGGLQVSLLFGLSAVALASWTLWLAIKRPRFR